MSYATGTTHYNLPQTVGTDKRDWFDTNQAFSDIDAAIYGAAQSASQAVTDLTALTTRVGTAENDIDTLETAVSTHTSQISAMQTNITQLGNAVTDNKQDVLDMIESTQEASATAAYAHAVGSYFIYNDTLYVTTVAIAVGDTIVPNTNCETTDIGTVLEYLNDFHLLALDLPAVSSGRTLQDVMRQVRDVLLTKTPEERSRAYIEIGRTIYRVSSTETDFLTFEFSTLLYNNTVLTSVHNTCRIDSSNEYYRQLVMTIPVGSSVTISDVTVNDISSQSSIGEVKLYI